MIGAPRTLRVRLTLIGLAGILVPLIVLLVVSLVSNETQSVTAGAGGTITERTRELSPWVPATAAALAIPAAVLAWWWAGRAVAPLRALTAVADDIQLTSLDRRIGAVDTPEEVTHLAASFDRMLDRLDVAATAERRFVEELSHQLRNPLAVLMTNTDVALAETAPTVDRLTEAIHTTKRITAQLVDVVDDLLAAAHAEQHSTQQIDIDLVQIADQVRDACWAAAQARLIDIRTTASSPCTVAVDGRSVRRAVTCLVENAIAHAPSGTAVTIEVTGGSRPSVAVSDHGPGIGSEDRAMIFERYWSGHDQSAGTGIGLAIVKQVGDANDGVEVASPITADGGTTFTMYFRAGGVGPSVLG